MNLADQLNAILTPRFADMGEVAEDMAEVIRVDMLANTEAGTSWQGAEYEREYAPSTAKRKRRVAPVTLRDKDLDLHTVHVVGSPNQAEIKFQNKGNIFYMHHHGQAKGGKIRTIFPKEIAQLPMRSIETLFNGVRRALSGR